MRVRNITIATVDTPGSALARNKEYMPPGGREKRSTPRRATGSPGYGVPGDIPCGKGRGGECRLQVVAPGVAVDIEHLADAVEVPHDPRDHRLWVNPVEGDAAPRRHRLVKPPEACHGEWKLRNRHGKRIPGLTGEVGACRSRRNPGDIEQPPGEPLREGEVAEDGLCLPGPALPERAGDPFSHRFRVCAAEERDPEHVAREDETGSVKYARAGEAGVGQQDVARVPPDHPSAPVYGKGGILKRYPGKVGERVALDGDRGERRGNLRDGLPEGPGKGVTVPGRTGGGIGGAPGGYDEDAGPDTLLLRPDEEPIPVPLHGDDRLAAPDGHPAGGALRKEDGKHISGSPGLREDLSPGFGLHRKAPVGKEGDEIPVREVSERGAEERPMIAVMGEKTGDLPVMGDVALS